MPPPDSSADYDDAVTQHENSFISLIKIGEAMKAEIAFLQKQLMAYQQGDLTATAAAEIKENAVQVFMAKHLIQYLCEANMTKIEMVCDMFASELDALIPQFVAKRYDSAVHAPSVMLYNGRSLDSHNPWHLEKSFEDYLSEELDGRQKRSPHETPSGDPNIIIEEIELAEAFSSFPICVNIIRNKVAEINSIPFNANLTPPFFKLSSGNTEVPIYVALTPPFYARERPAPLKHANIANA